LFLEPFAFVCGEAALSGIVEVLTDLLELRVAW